MPIYQIHISDPQYKALAQDTLKWVSIILTFCYLISMYHDGNVKNMVKCNNLFEHVIIFVVALMVYHLVVCEIIRIT